MSAGADRPEHGAPVQRVAPSRANALRMADMLDWFVVQGARPAAGVLTDAADIIRASAGAANSIADTLRNSQSRGGDNEQGNDRHSNQQEVRAHRVD